MNFIMLPIILWHGYLWDYVDHYELNPIYNLILYNLSSLIELWFFKCFTVYFKLSAYIIAAFCVTKMRNYRFS